MPRPRLEVVQPHDPWKLEGSEPYSVDKFYVTARNTHDHTERINLRIHPSLIAEIQELIGRGAIPEYRSFQDFVRDACQHRMEYLRGKVSDPAFDRYVKAEQRKAVFARIEREMDEQWEELEAIRGRLRTASERGDKGAIAEVLDYCDTELENFRSPYREQVQQLMESYKLQAK